MKQSKFRRILGYIGVILLGAVLVFTFVFPFFDVSRSRVKISASAAEDPSLLTTEIPAGAYYYSWTGSWDTNSFTTDPSLLGPVFGGYSSTVAQYYGGIATSSGGSPSSSAVGIYVRNPKDKPGYVGTSYSFGTFLMTVYQPKFSDKPTLQAGPQFFRPIGPITDVYPQNDSSPALSTYTETIVFPNSVYCTSLVAEVFNFYYSPIGGSSGSQSSYEQGYQDGYNMGQTESLSNPVSFFLQPIQTFLDTKLFGNFSIGMVLNVVLFVALALIFIKMFAGG